MAEKYLDLEGLEYFKGKQDAANDAEFAKLTDVPASVSDLVNDAGYQTESQLQAAINSALSSVLTWKGVKSTVGELPTTGNKTGDIWHVSADSAEYAWDGSAWQALGGLLQASVAWGDITGKPSTFTPSTHAHTRAQITDFPSSMPASDVSAWAKAASKPTYTAAEVGAATASHTHAAMGGATASAAGTAGFVPAPASGQNTRYLRGDGTWQVPPNTTYAPATTSANGLMSAADKSKLDGIAAGATKYTHPASAAGAKASGLYKVATDAQGHVTGAVAVTKSDITALGIPAQDTNTTYSAATQSAAGLMSAADKVKLDGITTITTTEIDALFA